MATPKEKPASNNLNLVRLFAALLVLVGHGHIFMGQPDPSFLSWLTLGPLGVYIFFAISGYLIVESWERDPNLLRFFARRALRIFPALAVCTFASVFILGPLLTTVSLREYFDSRATWSYLQNIRLFIHFYLPGVFETNRVVAVNGSLWSLPIEFMLYILVAFVGAICANRWVWLSLVILFAGLTYFWAQDAKEAFVFYASDMRQLVICGTYFWAGAVFHAFNLKRFFSLSSAIVAFTALLCLEPFPQLLHTAAWLLLPFVVLSFGLAYSPSLNYPIRAGDYSYGIYIYAFPVQQTVAQHYPHMHLLTYTLLCAALTMALACASWHWIERPVMRFKPGKSAQAATPRNDYESLQNTSGASVR